MIYSAGDFVHIPGTRRTVELVHPLPRPSDDTVCIVETKGWCVLEDGKFRYYPLNDDGKLRFLPQGPRDTRYGVK